MSHRPITRSQTTSNPNLILPPLVNIHSAATSSSQKPPIFPTVVLIIMAKITPRNFVTWNNGIPLIPLIPHVVWGPIPSFGLKIIPKFIRECYKTLEEHLQDIANVCIIHGITKKNIAFRLLMAYFKGRALDLYRSLGPNTIGNWDQLGDYFFQIFFDNPDRSSLMHQLITIKRAP